MKQNNSTLANLAKWCGTVMLLFLFAGIANAQISGTVVDNATGDPLIGASVAIKGTNSGAVTDINGKYALPAKSGDVLAISYTGYTSQTILVGSERNIDVRMEEGASLDEVVVTGYSSQSRRDITGSVAIIDTKDMNKLASSNFVDQIQGKVAGVQTSSSGDPGASVFVRIRGFGTINNNEPLYVIDGVPVSNETSMNFLNPNDVESIQVLKDASSASIYGARAANGVVIITTKKGKIGKSKISVDIFTGTQNPTKYPDLLDPAGLLTLNQKLQEGAGVPFSSSLYVNNGGTWALPDYIVRSAAFTGGVAAGNPAADPSKYFLTTDPLAEQGVNYLIQQTNKSGTDWFRELFNSAPMQSYQVSAQGGSEAGNYYISGNMYDHTGMLIENNYKRYQARANASFKVKNRVRVGEHMNIAYQTGRGGIGNPNEGSALINSYRMPQIVPVRDIKGYYGGGYGTNSNAGNPVAQQERSRDNFGHSVRILGDVYGEVDILKNLTAKSLFGVDYNTGRNKGYGFRNFEATEVNAANSLNESQYTNTNWVWTNTLRFSQQINDDIKLDLLGGTEARRNQYIGFNAGGSRLSFGDDVRYRVLGNVDSKTYRVGGYQGENSKFSLLGSANLNLMDKYLITATIRRDGSSRFLNNRYGVFPGVSVGWRLSQENFLKNSTAITDLKLIAGYGVTGNDEASGDNPGFSTFFTSPGTSSYDITGSGNSVVSGFEQGSDGNPDLKWETTKMLNIGFDLTLFKNLQMNFEWYDRKTEDLIYPVEPPGTTGSVGARNENIGTMQNVGIDLQLNYKGKVNKDFGYNVGLTFSRYKNEVTALNANENTFIRAGGSRIGDITYNIAGQPLSQFYGYIVDGLWSSDEEISRVLSLNKGDAKVGRYRYRDLNGDGQITALDETFIGSPHPDFIYGLNLSANIKNFDITLYFQGTQGNEIFNYVKYFSHTPAFQANYSREMLDLAGTTLPKLDNNDNYSNQRNSFYVEDGSYFRAKNVQVGYTLPRSILDKVGVDRFRIYLSAQNLFTLTKYSGLDPDVTIDNITEGFVGQRDYTLGIDRGRYPMARTILFGINCEF